MTAARARRRPRRDGDDGTATTDSPLGGDEIVPPKKGYNEAEENSPRNSAVRNLSLKG